MSSGSTGNEFERPKNPPPPLFTGEAEDDFVKQINDEISERVIGEKLLYYPIDVNNTNFHPVYGEAIEKNFLAPVRVQALVEFHGKETVYDEDVHFDEKIEITAHFHKRRITEDQELYVEAGDFIRYGEQFYEIHTTEEPRRIFGRIDNQLEIAAHCLKAREGVFEGQ